MATIKQIPVLAGKIVECQDGFNALTTENAQAAILDMPAFIACACEAWTNRTAVAQVQKTEGYLRLISGEETLLLYPTDGTQSIGHSSAVFGWIDPDFKNWGLNTGSNLATEETAVQVNEIIKNGTFRKIFGSLGGNLDALCLTQDQIVQFCQKHPSWLRSDGDKTFFLFKVGAKFFVAYVYVYDDGSLFVRVHKLANDRVWAAGYQRRVVVPQLEPATL
jgi:hypothetical protein